MSSGPPASKKPAITLDGLSGSGKSTLARQLALELEWAYLDSGAWYRALTWAVLQNQADPADSEAILSVLSQITLSCRSDGNVLIDGVLIDHQLRTPEIDQAVSIVADHGDVREALNQRMRLLRDAPDILGVVADGRDAGAIIFPDASLKIFVEVDVEMRAKRRYQQQLEAKLPVDYASTLAALQDRDQHDRARGTAAPQIHPGDRVLNNESVTVEEAIRRLLLWASELSAV
jgi:CMP/dCMP kinase